MQDIWLIRSTFASKDEAISTAHTLLAERLVACANISEDLTSVYRWEGMTQQEQEVEMLGKTSGEKVDKAIARIKALHSYQVPSIVAWKCEKADARFAEWVITETEN